MATQINKNTLKNYFQEGEFTLTEKDLKKFFPTLLIKEFGSNTESCGCNLESPEKSYRSIIVQFSLQQKEVTFKIGSGSTYTREKVIKSYTQLLKIKDLLIIYLFCGIRKVPEIKKWKKFP